MARALVTGNHAAGYALAIAGEANRVGFVDTGPFQSICRRLPKGSAETG